MDRIFELFISDLSSMELPRFSNRVRSWSVKAYVNLIEDQDRFLLPVLVNCLAQIRVLLLFGFVTLAPGYDDLIVGFALVLVDRGCTDEITVIIACIR